METNDPLASQCLALAGNVLPFRRKEQPAAAERSGAEARSIFDLSGARSYSREVVAECLRKGRATGSSLPELVAHTATENESPAPGEPGQEL